MVAWGFRLDVAHVCFKAPPLRAKGHRRLAHLPPTFLRIRPLRFLRRVAKRHQALWGRLAKCLILSA